MRRVTLVLIVVLLMGSSACRKQDNNVPFVNVNVTINTLLPQYQNLLVPSGFEYLTGGSRGLIVHRATVDEFNVYDRHSTFNVSQGCRVSVEDDNFTVKDECSDSKWSILDGTVLNGPATAPLQQYNTTWNDPFLTITN